MKKFTELSYNYKLKLGYIWNSRYTMDIFPNILEVLKFINEDKEFQDLPKKIQEKLYALLNKEMKFETFIKTIKELNEEMLEYSGMPSLNNFDF